MNINMAKEIGFQPLPVALKILFVLFLIGFLGFPNLEMLNTVGFSVLGFTVYGIVALVALVLFNYVGSIALLVAMWYRLKWTPVYAYIYTILATISGFLALIDLPARIAPFTEQVTQNAPYAEQSVLMGAYLGISIAIILNLIFLFIFFHTRKYFEVDK